MSPSPSVPAEPRGPRPTGRWRRRWIACTSRATARASRRSSPVASSNAWPSRARSSTARRSCSWTSRSARSTRSCASRCSSRSSTSSVTHDQEEALTMSDRIAVMRHGRVVQLGPPEDLYERPADQFVADFIGQSNFLEVTVRSVQDGIATAVTESGLDVCVAVGEAGAEGTRVTLAIRPERVRLARAGRPIRTPTLPDASAYRWWDGVIEEVVYIGATRKYQVRVRSQVLVAQQQAGADVSGLRAGERVNVGWSMADLRVVHTH